MGQLIIISETCDYCQRARSPRDICHMPGGVKICAACEQRHVEALNSLASGVFTGECAECGLKADELRARGNCGPSGEMAVHYEGGRYKCICLRCDPIYVRKRRDLYGKTQFGHSIGLN